MSDLEAERRGIQKRVVRVLQLGVIPGGLAMTSGYAAAALLGSEITGSETKGALAAMCLSLGGTLLGLPLGVIMARRGRRLGLTIGYLSGALGGFLASVAALTGAYILLVLGMVLIGSGQASNLAARYTGADLASDQDRAESMSLVMWANTVGSVLGPTIGLGLTSLGSENSTARFALPYIFSTVLFSIAASIIFKSLKPDPLHIAAKFGGVSDIKPPSFSALKKLVSHPTARLGLLGMMLSQAVMVGVMTVTPLHMKDGGQSTAFIGLMISLHIVGMYAFSPLVGKLTDHFGCEVMIGLGALMLALGAEVASHTSAPDAMGHIVGLFLVGVGWNFCIVAAGSLIVSAFEPGIRVATQASADVLMTATGATAGISSGLAVEQRSFHDLAHWAMFVGLALAVITTISVVRRQKVVKNDEVPAT